jgi:hypothetical protein
MSVNIPSWYVSQFSTNIQLLLQQKGSRLRGSVMEMKHVGKQASPVDQIGAIAAQKVIGRFNPMSRVDAALDRRWVFPVDYDLPQLIDSFDKLRILTDPSSKYVENAVYAMGRAMDDEIIAAYHGTSKTGVDGSTSTTLPAGQVVNVNQGAAAATGLTVAKLREAKRILMANEVDLENDPLYIPVNAYAHDNLLAEAQIIDTDYSDMPVLMEGKISRFLGFNFIHTERLLTGTDNLAGTSYLVPAYAKSGMHLGLWEDIMSDISQRKDIQSLPYQAYVKGTFGATRLEEKKVVKIYVR